jgi:hypothetical protein
VRVPVTPVLDGTDAGFENTSNPTASTAPTFKLTTRLKLGVVGLTEPFEWVGKNTMLIYLLSPSGGQFAAWISLFYFGGDHDSAHALPSLFYTRAFCGTEPCSAFAWTPHSLPPASLSNCTSWDHTIAGCTEASVDGQSFAIAIPSICSICTTGLFAGRHERHAQLTWTLLRILFWMGVAGCLHTRRWYWAV